ncbi:hypothetical protein ACQ33O_05385 [Ferruginibacter sp. SUN002]|uniref:hypothetical protein n=1 Tax=Ferruginibacter sp. SUN002 TaxID=2937789 RepID=UPI003D367C96
MSPTFFAYHLKILFPSVFLLFLIGCKERAERKIDRSFYYWKSVFTLTDFEKKKLDSLDIKTLYIKFFDVTWDEFKKQPNPTAIIDGSKQKLPEEFIVIPTVFITNECMQKIDSSQLTELSNNINNLISKVLNINGFNSINEVQIDCDWTSTTKDNYFSLLRKIKEHWKNIAIPISATIRLHQIKYISKSGVPPVDKGLLMCYNMGNLKNPATKNSILDISEMKKYIGNLGSYPLQLDVALPLFDWHVLFRNNRYEGLIEDITLTNNSAVKKTNETSYTFLKDTLFNGLQFRKDDIIRYEQSEYKEIISAAKIVSEQLQTRNLKLSFFHLDSLTLSKYSIYELESIYNSLR